MIFRLDGVSDWDWSSILALVVAIVGAIKVYVDKRKRL
jgi:hypothetical protein